MNASGKSTYSGASPTAGHPSGTPLRMPQIDYDAHPAYGKLTPHPGVATRLKAHLLFWSNISFVFVRWLVDYDNLPLLTRHREGRSWASFFRIALPYLVMLVRTKARRLFRNLAQRPRTMAPPASVYKTLDRDGIAAVFLTEEEKQLLKAESRSAFERLRARRAAEFSGKRQFEDSRLRTSRVTDTALYAAVEKVLATHGVLDAARTYLGRRVGVKDINPQINDLTDDFWRDQFADVGLPNSRTTYVHFDAGYKVLKLILYMSPVDSFHGPFSYIRGSNRLEVSFWEGLVRRANDYSGLSSTSPGNRELFSALPRALRKKCALGADIQDGTPDSERILANEWHVTSKEGDAILFDPFGLHRGGLITEGERVVLTVVIGVVD